MSWVPPSSFNSNSQFSMILSIISTATSNFIVHWQKVVVLSIALQFIFFDGRGILLAYLPLPKWVRDGPPLDLDDSDLPALEPDPRLLLGVGGGDLDLTHAEFQFVRRGESQQSSTLDKQKQSRRDNSSPSSRCMTPSSSEPTGYHRERDEYVFHAVFGTIPREVRDLWEYQEQQEKHKILSSSKQRNKVPPVRGSSGNSAQNSPVNIDRKSLSASTTTITSRNRNGSQ